MQSQLLFFVRDQRLPLLKGIWSVVQQFGVSAQPSGRDSLALASAPTSVLAQLRSLRLTGRGVERENQQRGDLGQVIGSFVAHQPAERSQAALGRQPRQLFHQILPLTLLPVAVVLQKLFHFRWVLFGPPVNLHAAYQVAGVRATSMSSLN